MASGFTGTAMPPPAPQSTDVDMATEDSLAAEILLGEASQASELMST